jgi:hypothetical protein
MCPLISTNCLLIFKQTCKKGEAEMKKILLISLATIMVAVMSIPAAAVENEFGGYWRTRALNEQDMDGTDSGSTSYVDTRTRLYYTAKFNENLKFVNKFEFDTAWGDDVAGDIGADGNNFELKNSYVDFTMGSVNTKIGMHGEAIARSFLFDDDFSGVTLTYNAGTMSLPFIWVKAVDKDVRSDDPLTPLVDESDVDNLDYYILNPTFNVSDTLSVNPFLFYAKEEGTDTNVYFLGADVDSKVGDMDVWGTLIYQTGEANNTDISAYLVAAGADAGLVHGQFFYASGQDPDETDITEFTPPAGRSYYWSEIMGYGIFDNNSSNNSPADGISNVMALNVGTTVKPMEKLSVSADLWYAQLVEDVMVNGSMESDLGVEVDLLASYQLMDNLSLDVVAAYLFAGDATGEEDPIELGTQLSLSF